MRCRSPSGVPRHPRASEPGALRNHRRLPNTLSRFTTPTTFRHIFSANPQEYPIVHPPDIRSEDIGFVAAKCLR